MHLFGPAGVYVLQSQLIVDGFFWEKGRQVEKQKELQAVSQDATPIPVQNAACHPVCSKLWQPMN